MKLATERHSDAWVDDESWTQRVPVDVLNFGDEPIDGRLIYAGHCARLEVPQEQALRWAGWRQKIAAKPNSTYFYGCYVKTEGVTDGQVRLLLDKMAS